MNMAGMIICMIKWEIWTYLVCKIVCLIYLHTLGFLFRILRIYVLQFICINALIFTSGIVKIFFVTPQDFDCRSNHNSKHLIVQFFFSEYRKWKEVSSSFIFARLLEVKHIIFTNLKNIWIHIKKKILIWFLYIDQLNRVLFLIYENVFFYFFRISGLNI